MEFEMDDRTKAVLTLNGLSETLRNAIRDLREAERILDKLSVADRERLICLFTPQDPCKVDEIAEK
jgi:hypothetical protein